MIAEVSEATWLLGATIRKTDRKISENLELMDETGKF
jgi:hypothetical protein